MLWRQVPRSRFGLRFPHETEGVSETPDRKTQLQESRLGLVSRGPIAQSGVVQLLSLLIEKCRVSFEALREIIDTFRRTDDQPSIVSHAADQVGYHLLF
jgi:hypothetical protein